MILAISCFFILFLLFIKKKWCIIVIQIFTYGGVIVWIQTLIELINLRIDTGEPWLRMTFILIVIIILTLISGLLLNTKIIKEKYNNI